MKKFDAHKHTREQLKRIRQLSEKLQTTALGPLKKNAWKPVVRNGDGTIEDNKLGGIPWLSEKEEWPKCPNCGKEMRLFLQLNPKSLPEQIGEFLNGRILQIFYCTNMEPFCEADTNAYDPGGNRSKLLRLVTPGKPKTKITMSDFSDFIKPGVIISWEEFEEYPNWEEADTIIGQAAGKIFEAAGVATMEFSVYQGDKLGGWPCWIHDVDYPTCKVCGKKMSRFIFQFMTNENLKWSFLDGGKGYVFQCPIHHDELDMISQG